MPVVGMQDIRLPGQFFDQGECRQGEEDIAPAIDSRIRAVDGCFRVDRRSGDQVGVDAVHLHLVRPGWHRRVPARDLKLADQLWMGHLLAYGGVKGDHQADIQRAAGALFGRQLLQGTWQ